MQPLNIHLQERPPQQVAFLVPKAEQPPGAPALCHGQVSTAAGAVELQLFCEKIGL
jgi:hypothetical protein